MLYYNCCILKDREIIGKNYDISESVNVLNSQKLLIKLRYKKNKKISFSFPRIKHICLNTKSLNLIFRFLIKCLKIFKKCKHLNI